MSQIEDEKKVIPLDFKIEKTVSRLLVLAIFDKKLSKYLPPFITQSIEDGKRQFTNLVNYTDSLIAKFPEDYELHYLSDFYDDIGHFTVAETKILLTGSNAKRDDSIKYNKLLNEVESQKNRILGLITEYKKLTQPVPTEQPKTLELYQPVSTVKSGDKTTKSRINRILDILFK